jgi:hypothetical protein
VRSNAMLRNRLLADPSFVFKILTEVCVFLRRCSTYLFLLSVHVSFSQNIAAMMNMVIV